MTGYRNEYLKMLKAEKSKKAPGEELPKLTKPPSPFVFWVEPL
jgi:hypothetical protein